MIKEKLRPTVKLGSGVMQYPKHEIWLAAAQTEVDANSLEGVVADWFSHHGMRINSVEIKAVGKDGDWVIGEATRRGGLDYHGLARRAEKELRPKYKLVVVEVTRIGPAPLES